mgnify:CR=1 FL=1
MAEKRSVQSLRQERAKAVETAEAILASDAADKNEKFAEAAATVDRLDAEIGNLERLEKLRGAAANPSEETVKQTVGGFAARYANLPAVMHKPRAGQVLAPAQLAAFGDFLRAVARDSRHHVRDPLLIEASLGGNETVGEDGGFMVEKDINDALLTRTFEMSTIAQKVRRIPISAKSNGIKINALKDNSRATGSRWGGVQAYWIGEGESMTPTRPRFRQMNLQLKKLSGLMYATDEMLQDSTALAAVMSMAFPSEFAFMVDDAIFEGAGGATPLGFMNANMKVSVAKETGQAAATIVYENILKMFARLPARSVASAEWWINQNVLPQMMALHQIIGTGGVPVYLPPGGLSGSPYGTLLGRPVIPIEYCSALGTEGDIVLADPSNYVLIDKGDIQSATSIHVAFLTNEQAFRFIYRVDGQPVDDLPITPFKGAETQSSFVTLATRA